MKLELASATNFLAHLIRLGRRNKNINDKQLDNFRLGLVEVLRRRYRDHWFPERPFKGSGYRCIRINGKMDAVIVQAGESCGLSPALVHSIFPSELTMWIDPLEVSYRIGENGSICVLYEFKEGVNEPWRPNTNLNSTSSSSSGRSGAVMAPPTPNRNLLKDNNAKNNSNNGGGSTTNHHSNNSNSSQVSNNSNAVVDSNNKLQQQQQHQAMCKDSLRKMDYLLDPRKSVSIEQLAAYVSS